MRKKLLQEPESISISRQCLLLGLSRHCYYYKPALSEYDLRLMRAIDEVYTEDPTRGTRRISAVLKRGYGIIIGRYKIRKLMRIVGVSAIYPKPRLSMPVKEHKKYPYLLRGLDIKYPNHVWSTDITYVRLKQGFVYLVAIIDWYSRKVLSWRLSTSLDSGFCVEALKEALEKYGYPEIFNTDQGSQFTSEVFTKELIDRNILISMDGKGRALDNIFVERLWRTVKYQNIYINDYRTVKECREGLKSYFTFYNIHREHSSLDYKSPDEVYYGYRSIKRAV